MPRTNPLYPLTVRGFVAVAAGALMLIAAPTAPAQEQPPIQDVSAIDQYRESVPTARGPRAVGQNASPKAKPAAKLPKRVQEQIRSTAGKDAALLERLATSADYGAPDTPAKPKSAATAETDAASAVGAGVGALSDDDGGSRWLVLLLVVGLIAVGGVGVAGWRIARLRRAQ